MLRFTIVIPNFNSGRILERALQSVLQQNYPHLQLIMADGDSQDESRAIIREYQHHFDPLIQQRDAGQVDALNRGFQSARGDIHGWLCADDELLPGSLAHLNEIFEADPTVEVVAGGCRHVYEDGASLCLPAPPDAWDLISVKNVFNQPSVFWRGSLHRRLGGLDPSYELAFDWDWWCRMCAAHARLTVTERVLSNYHFSADNKTSTGGRKHVDEGFRIIRRYGPYHGLLAHAYRFIYQSFDCHGCLDNPPTCSPHRLAAYRLSRSALVSVLGAQWMDRYNWQFASRQERKLKWWESA